jgi:hypothetical protein
MEIDAIGEVETAKDSTHQQMRLQMIRPIFPQVYGGEENTTNNDENPTQPANTPRHKKASRMDGAAIKQHPEDDQKKLNSHTLGAGVEDQDGASRHKTDKKSRQ